MNIVFITGIVTFHQIGFWDSFVSTNNDVAFCYLSTRDRSADIIVNKIGTSEENRNYIKKSKDLTNQQLKELITDSDVVFYASSFDKRVFKYLHCSKRLCFITEHFSKKMTIKSFLSMTRHFIKIFFYIGFKKTFLLANSFYAKKDYNLFLRCIKKTYRFGYFPNIPIKNISFLKKDNLVLWAGRMIEWKHPDTALKIFLKLKNFNKDLKMVFVGDGPVKKLVEEKTKEIGLSDCVSFFGFLNHGELLKLMSKSKIFIFSSDRQEGWGVPLNEAMSQGCIVFASSYAGATRFLVEDEINGFVYNNKNLDDKIKKYFILSDEDRKKMSSNAIKTIEYMWNPVVASYRLHEFCEAIIAKKRFNKYKEGPLSNY